MMLITRSTPRITYRIGIRAVLAILEDKSFPSLLVGVDDDVAAVFKLWNLNFIGQTQGCGRKQRPAGITKVLRRLHSGCGFGRESRESRTSDLGPQDQMPEPRAEVSLLPVRVMSSLMASRG